MNRVWLNAAVLLGLTVLAAPAPASSLQSQIVSFPPYETVPGLHRVAAAEDYRAAATDSRFVMERITYPSDDLSVFAYVYRPRVSNERLPVVIFNRGSWTWPAFSSEFLVLAHRLARRGYVVIAPMYRGSGGASGRDEMGGADLNDLMNLVPIIRAMDGVDADRLFLYGESRGGMMVYQALRDGFPARAAAVVGAFTDLDAMLADPQWQQAGAAIWPDLATRRAEIARRRSAIQWPERINIPILIIHGGDDSLVSPNHSLRMAGRLTDLDRDYQLIVVAGGSHTLSELGADRDAWVAGWFARHHVYGDNR